MIAKRLKIMTDQQEELNRLRALYQDALENDPKYQELQEQAQKFKEESKEKREKVKQTETLKAMEEQMKQLRTDMKETKEVLAQELADYYKDSGSMEITDADGNVKRFIFSVRLTDQN